jgi:hypothetical protein
MTMEHEISGRLHWDTTHAATPGWLLFLDGHPGDIPTMRPGLDRSLPRDASHAEVARLIGEMLQRETGHLPQQVQFTHIEDGLVYSFVATYKGSA